jgi:bacterioferritin-associated ferredoxin
VRIESGVHPDDDVCLCFHVSLRKIRAYVERENPPVPSLISECLGAGTGCGWCVPYLKRLHQLHVQGKPMDLPVSPEEYASKRVVYRSTGARPGEDDPA